MFGDNLKILRKKSNLTQKQLAVELKLAESTVSMYERNKRQPSFEKLDEIADFFNVDMNFLHSYNIDDGFINTDNFNFVDSPIRRIPLINSVACNEPDLTKGNMNDYVEPFSFTNTDYAILAKGDSMVNANIENGDLIFVKQTNQVENGQIAIFCIENEATLKRFRRTKDTVMLVAENNEINPIILSEEQDAKVLGVATHIVKVL